MKAHLSVAFTHVLYFISRAAMSTCCEEEATETSQCGGHVKQHRNTSGQQHRIGVCVDVVDTDPVRSGVMKRDEASFVLGVDISPVLQQILCHLQVVVAS